MRDALGLGTVLGYCTNVHAGAGADAMFANLRSHALGVKQRVAPHRPMGVGLWLSARAASELLRDRRVPEVRDFLLSHGLLPFTFNGFPHGDFHEPVVKHRVYHPAWDRPERLAYTLDLARILAELLEPGDEGSISTLPLGWRGELDGAGYARCVEQLRELAVELDRLEERTGRSVHVDLEPEPGCVLDRAGDVVKLFERLGEASAVRRRLRVCHDICHSAVMFEPQREAFAAYRDAGVLVGKVQVSSAVRLDFEALDAPARVRALNELRAFDERRYLHQTCVCAAEGGPVSFFEDLPLALRSAGDAPRGEWRVHFHVPLHIASFGSIGTTQADVVEALREAVVGGGVRHFEAETYAWGVLPEPMRSPTLSAGIADELAWLMGVGAGAAR